MGASGWVGVVVCSGVGVGDTDGRVPEMTEAETTVYVTDREALRVEIARSIASALGLDWEHENTDQGQALEVADASMTVVDSLLEWGSGYERQWVQARATAGNLQKLLDASQEALRQQSEQADRIFALCGESPEDCSAGSLAAFVEEYTGRAQATIEAQAQELANSKQLQASPSLGAMAGYMIAGPGKDGTMEADWDGKVHQDIADAMVELRKCQKTYTDWRLYELRQAPSPSELPVAPTMGAETLPPFELKPALADPETLCEADEDGVAYPGQESVGWDMSFGCRLNFDQVAGGLQFLLSISDWTQKRGVERRTVTPEQVRSFATQLLALLPEADDSAADETPEETAKRGRSSGVQLEMDSEPWKEQRCARDGIIAAFCPCDRPDVTGLPPRVQSEVDSEPADCGACFRCVSPKWGEFQSHPVVCATCGNKRCPHASDHVHACTGSNAYGQPGSDYAPLPVSSVRDTAEPARSSALDDTHYVGDQCAGGHRPESISEACEQGRSEHANSHAAPSARVWHKGDRVDHFTTAEFDDALEGLLHDEDSFFYVRVGDQYLPVVGVEPAEDASGRQAVAIVTSPSPVDDGGTQ